MIATVESSKAIVIPEMLKDDFEFKLAKRLSINGAADQAHDVTRITDNLSTLTRFYSDSSVQMANDQLRVLDMPHAKGKRNVIEEHTKRLISGHGLAEESSATEAMFVGSNRSRISVESAIWLGRALSAPNIERIYYLGNNIRDIAEFENEDKVVRIANYLDSIRLVSKISSLEFGFVEATEKFNISEEVIR